MGIIEWIILAALAIPFLTRAYRWWSVRYAVWIIVGRPTAFLFELARRDGPVNRSERKYIAAYALTAFESLRKRSPLSLDSNWLDRILRKAESPPGSVEKELYLCDLASRQGLARSFFEICCALACVDGEMAWSEREWLETQGTFSMVDPHWFMPVLERKCPCSRHPAAPK